uniref:hypothetical protein n=3 Tax=Pseudomonas TaxID=286 RepID=UPI00155D8C8A|nr:MULTISPECIES: hypothetical protein [Pseudomonas]
MQSDRDVLVAREVVDILHFHHQPWIMPPPSSPPTPVPGFSGLSGSLGRLCDFAHLRKNNDVGAVGFHSVLALMEN